MELRHLDSQRAEVLALLCEAIVPGSARVQPVVYIDAVMGFMPEPQRAHLIEAIDALAEPVAGGAEGLEPHSHSPDFMMIRALAAEAFYSDFVAPGAPGPGAYEEIDFHTPLAMRIKKDWSFLGVGG